jgi:hypothetical protein
MAKLELIYSIAIILFFIVGLNNPYVIAQVQSAKTNESNKENTNFLTTLAPIATGIIGASASLFAVLITNRHNMKKEEIQRNLDSIQDKLNIYSFFIFSLDKIMSTEAVNEYLRISDDVDATIKSKYYLLNPSLLTNWADIRSIVLFANQERPGYQSGGFSSKGFDEFYLKVITLWESLVLEYNQKVISTYDNMQGTSKSNKRNGFRTISRIPIGQLSAQMSISKKIMKPENLAEREITRVEIAVRNKNANDIPHFVLVGCKVLDSTGKVIKSDIDETNREGIYVMEAELSQGIYRIEGEVGCKGFTRLLLEKQFEVKADII